MGRAEPAAQLEGARGDARGGLEIGIVQGHVELAELRQIHLGAGLPGEAGGQFHQFPVPGAAPDRGGEGEQPERRQLDVIENRISTPSTNSAEIWPALVWYTRVETLSRPSMRSVVRWGGPSS